MFTLLPTQGSTDLDHIQIIKKVGGKLTDSYLDEGEAGIPVEGTVFSRYRGVGIRFYFGQVDRGELSKEARRCQNPHRQHMYVFWLTLRFLES